MRSARQVLHSISTSYLRVAVLVVVGFFLTPVLFHGLQPANYALLAFGLAMVSALSIVEFGLGVTITRYASELHALERREELRRLGSSIFNLSFLIACAVAGAVALGAESIAVFFRLPVEPAAPVLVVLALSLPAEIAASALRGYLNGLQEFTGPNLVEMAVVVLRAAAVILALQWGWGLLGVAVLFLASSVLRAGALLVAARFGPWPFTPRLGEIHLDSLRRVKMFVFFSFQDDSARRLLSESVHFVVARVLPLPDLALLAIARRIPSALHGLARQPALVMDPIVIGAAARGDRHILQRFVVLGTRTLLAFVLPASLTLVVWAEGVLYFWIGPEGVAAAPALRALVIWSIALTLQEIPLSVLYAYNRVALCSAVSMSALVLSVAGGVPVAGAFGLAGMVTWYAAVQVAATTILYGYTLPLGGVSLGALMRRAMAPVAFAAVPAFAWLSLSRDFLGEALWSLLLSAIAGVALFGGVFSWYVLRNRPGNWRAHVRELVAAGEVRAEGAGAPEVLPGK